MLIHYFLNRFYAFLQLIRWPNLLFIGLTQSLFIFFVLNPILRQGNIVPILQGLPCFLFIFSTILVAAGSYIINDYFDANRDLMTRPNEVIIGKIIHRHWAIACHSVFSAVGVIIGFYLDFTSSTLLLGPINFGCTFLLFLYSISLKKTPIAGNILISLLTAWTIYSCTWCNTGTILRAAPLVDMAKITRLTLMYGGFAFILSLIREALKDMEDIDIDRKVKYHTMPIVWGNNASRIFILVWMIVMMGLLGSMFFYLLVSHRWIPGAYCLIFVTLPFLKLIKDFSSAKSVDQYRRVRSQIKWIMLTGILSMLLSHL
ncbi:MAG: ubiquinone biosynthesis protein UbiA [Pseudopedobacter saltans]|uniref:Ubiquinone biosynthesis protein UbiA n=1 Tax=Pseudopedobacter saltans TaxID=151895 RepID=A0A2W5H0X3_9SPHI|nr:MAG: ubiquinone biosynthesis protein UbiA [Pseudopedobacter saltans]